MKNKNSKLILFILFFAMISYGMYEGYGGISIPLLKAEFSVSDQMQGVFNAMINAGSIIATLIASFTITKYGLKNTMVLGLCIASIGMLAMSSVPTYLVTTMVFFFMKIGLMTNEMAVNGLAATASNSPGKLLTYTHLFFGIGAVLGPKIAGYAIDGGYLSWRSLYILAAIASVLLLATVLLSKKKDKENNATVTEPIKVNFKELYKSPDVILFACTLAFVGQTEYAINSWGVIYLQDRFDMDAVTQGATFLSMFFIFFTISRLLSGFYIEKISYVLNLKICLVCAVITTYLGFLLGESGIWILVLSGFFVATLWPTLLAIMTKTYGKTAPVVMSVVTTVCSICMIGIQLLTGFIAGQLGSCWGFMCNLIYAPIALILFISLVRYVKIKKNIDLSR